MIRELLLAQDYSPGKQPHILLRQFPTVTRLITV